MATKQYVLGKGKLFFNKFAPGTLVGSGERYIGNTPELTISVSSESLDHYNSDEGIRVKDDSTLLEITRAGSFVTDHIDVENLALFLLGGAATLTEAGGTVTAEAINGVKPGLFYQLGTSTTNPSGVRKVTSVVVKDDTTPTPITYVAGTDYVLDAELGRIEIVVGGAITDGKNLRIDYTISASTREQIITSGEIIEGALRFVSANPKGPKRDFFMPHVKLTPNGDFALKGEEWQQISFSMEILKKDANTEAIYVDGRPV